MQTEEIHRKKPNHSKGETGEQNIFPTKQATDKTMWSCPFSELWKQSEKLWKRLPEISLRLSSLQRKHVLLSSCFYLTKSKRSFSTDHYHVSQPC